jgi:hypothetical protein
MNKITQGTRFYPNKERDYPNIPGEYMQGTAGRWELCLPTGIHGAINDKTWAVTEHHDGTITVSPSINTTCPDTSRNWHGFLEKGIWREC